MRFRERLKDAYFEQTKSTSCLKKSKNIHELALNFDKSWTWHIRVQTKHEWISARWKNKNWMYVRT